MIFDSRIFLGESFDGKKKDPDVLLRSMDKCEIDMALACPFKPISYDLHEANSKLSGMIHPYQDRFVGAARIDPWQADAVDTLHYGIETLGMRAVYLNPWEENFQANAEILDPVMSAAESNNVPVILAAGYPWVSEALQILNLALRWPDVNIIMTNGGQINISGLGQANATLALVQSPNLHIDTAGIYRQDFIDETVADIGGERVLFGSGSPYFDQCYEIKRVKVAEVSEKDRSLIFYENAKRLLKFV